MRTEIRRTFSSFVDVGWDERDQLQRGRAWTYWFTSDVQTGAETGEDEGDDAAYDRGRNLRRGRNGRRTVEVDVGGTEWRGWCDLLEPSLYLGVGKTGSEPEA